MSVWLISPRDIAFGLQFWIIGHIAVFTSLRIMRGFALYLEHHFIKTWWDKALFAHGLAKYDPDHHNLDVLNCEDGMCFGIRR